MLDIFKFHVNTAKVLNKFPVAYRDGTLSCVVCRRNDVFLQVDVLIKGNMKQS